MHGGEHLTHHHLTPRSICKVWRIPYKTMNSPANIEMLPEKLHERQDRVVPMLLQRAIDQANGRVVKLWDHHNEMLIFQDGMPKHEK